MRPSDTPEGTTRRALIALGKAQSQEFYAILERFARQRWAFRLGAHARRADLMVKGASLWPLWVGEPARASEGLDLLDMKKLPAAELRALILDIGGAALPDTTPPDGLVFDVNSLVVSPPKRTASGYVFTPMRLQVSLGAAQLPLQLNVASGDMPTPPPEEVELPTLLSEFAGAKVRAASKETCLAEKLHMCLGIGFEHQRMQDLYDMYLLVTHAHLSGSRLIAAIRHTLDRRMSRLPSDDLPPFLTPDFVRSGVRNAAWNAYKRKLQLKRGLSLPEIMSALQMFFITPLELMGRNHTFTANWQGSGLWE